jgi:hypothetical protein
MDFMAMANMHNGVEAGRDYYGEILRKDEIDFADLMGEGRYPYTAPD